MKENVFRRQLESLSGCCEFLDYQAAVSLIKSGDVNCNVPKVAFTFDDGFDDCSEYIAPVLNEFGIKGCFFINPNFCLGSESYRKEFSERAVLLPGKLPMEVAQVRKLADQGHVIGAHTMDHALLLSNDDDFLVDQIVHCKRAVESISEKKCDDFAWTYGGYKHISQKAIDLALSCYGNVLSSDNHHYYLGNDGENLSVINRRHFEPYWPSSHVKYFLSKKKSSYKV
ncbi:polysaccharide deacetylase family protein [Alcanivorax sp.]|uniref:polysaccharide deacetylase family protein n=1 Tax=Alcanivorax sp. TaxID=1872427 RepID=UPI0025C3FB0A|nr:polysaccharide deacetylase family protein [Alcanivorax sp.]